MQSVAVARDGFGRAAELRADAFDHRVRFVEREVSFCRAQRFHRRAVLAFDPIDAVVLESQERARST